MAELGKYVISVVTVIIIIIIIRNKFYKGGQGIVFIMVVKP